MSGHYSTRNKDDASREDALVAILEDNGLSRMSEAAAVVRWSAGRPPPFSPLHLLPYTAAVAVLTRPFYFLLTLYRGTTHAN